MGQGAAHRRDKQSAALVPRLLRVVGSHCSYRLRLPGPSCCSVRKANWQFDMLAMLALLLLILPGYHCYVVLHTKLPPLKVGSCFGLARPGLATTQH